MAHAVHDPGASSLLGRNVPHHARRLRVGPPQAWREPTAVVLMIVSQSSAVEKAIPPALGARVVAYSIVKYMLLVCSAITKRSVHNEPRVF